MVDRSVLALDRDQVNFRIKFANNSKSDIDVARVDLIVQALPKVGVPMRCSPRQVVSSARVECNCKSGDTQEVGGTLRMPAGIAPPSLQSSAIDLVYSLVLAG